MISYKWRPDGPPTECPLLEAAACGYPQWEKQTNIERQTYPLAAHLEVPPESFKVSTIFLTYDLSFGEGPPILFETMVLGAGPWGKFQERYTTQELAEKGHEFVVDAITRGLTPGYLEEAFSDIGTEES